MKRLATAAAKAVRAPLNVAANGAATAAAVSHAQTDDLSALVSLFDFESAARSRISRMYWEYMSGVADEITLRWNREAYDRLQLCPKVLVDVSHVDTTVNLLGRKFAHPILLAPAADHRMIHPEGELATARGAADAGAICVVSSFSNTSFEEVAKGTAAELWFQVYVQRDRGFTRDVVQRVEATGCKALCVTVDAPVFGARNRQARAKYALAEGLSRPHLPPPSKSTAGGLQVFTDFVEPALSWRDIDWLRSISTTPILLKGVLDPDDADRAVAEGVAGVIVSNHGARNLDTVPATITALPRVVEKVAGRIPVLVDGGIRRGTDVVKAIALGAAAVLIGRPYLYGLAVGGATGVTRVIDILRSELEMAMCLLGRPSIEGIDRSALWEQS